MSTTVYYNLIAVESRCWSGSRNMRAPGRCEQGGIGEKEDHGTSSLVFVVYGLSISFAVGRVGQFCRQYYWEQYIGPLLAKIPIILLLLVLVVIHNFKFHIFVIVLLLLVFKIRNIGLFLVHIWYCVGIVHFQALITKVKIIQ